MTAREWLALRGVELLAAVVVAAILIGGLWAGVPFLRSRIGEVMLYSVACVAAVILRSALDLVARSIAWLGLAARGALRLRPVPRTHPAA